MRKTPMHRTFAHLHGVNALAVVDAIDGHQAALKSLT